MLPKVLSGHPETPDTSFSDAAQSDAGRGAASRALCLLPSQMRAGAQRAPGARSRSSSATFRKRRDCGVRVRVRVNPGETGRAEEREKEGF